MSSIIHRGMLAEDYHKLPALSNSAMKHLSRSPAHYRAWKDTPQPDAAHFITGRATHAAILEPDVFGAQFVRQVEGNGATKAVKEARAEQIEQYGAGNVVPAADYDAALGMRDAVWSHPRAKALLSGRGEQELSGVWADPDTGVLCKCRPDRISYDLEGGTVVDIKTTPDARPESFARDVAKFAYYRQAGHYLNGMDALEIPAKHFCIIAVEKAPPYGVRLYVLDVDDVELGRREARQLVALYDECKKAKHWPAYTDRIEPLSMPQWAWSEISERTTPR